LGVPELESGRELLCDEPPGVSAPPVAAPPLPRPKYEMTLLRHPGSLRLVVASNPGADSNLLASPVKTKLG